MSATWLSGYKRQDFGTSGGSWTRQPAIIVIHSTEGKDHGWPGYDGGQSCPHFTHDPLNSEGRQHVSLAEASRALKNASGGVETNRGGAVQIEVIGTCDPNNKGHSGWTYLPDLKDWSGLHKMVSDISAATGIPLTSSVTWKAYPGSYGTGASQRLSGSKWNSYKGVLGHQHVPENDHGDPGNIDIDAILGGDMPLSDDDIKKIWNATTTNPIDGSPVTFSNLLRWAYAEAHGVWLTETTSPVDGSEVDTLTLLRWAYGEAHKAAGEEKPEPPVHRDDG